MLNINPEMTASVEAHTYKFPHSDYTYICDTEHNIKVLSADEPIGKSNMSRALIDLLIAYDDLAIQHKKLLAKNMEITSELMLNKRAVADLQDEYNLLRIRADMDKSSIVTETANLGNSDRVRIECHAVEYPNGPCECCVCHQSMSDYICEVIKDGVKSDKMCIDCAEQELLNHIAEE